MKGVHVPDAARLERKLDALYRGGKESLHIISDFDATLTHLYKDGRRALTSLGVTRSRNYLSPEYAKAANDLADIYRPIEYDMTLSLEVRTQKMEEWWQKHLELMIAHGMSKEVVDTVVDSRELVLRSGVDELLQLAEENNIPLLVFSAGLGDIIIGCLQQEGRMNGNVHIISNFYNYDQQGKVTGYKSTTIHVYNKNEEAVRGTPYAGQIQQRRNVVLLGDRPGDLSMAKGFPHDVCLNIGFLNGLHDQLDSFAGYDIVVLDDGDMSVMLEIMQKIVP